MEGGRSGGSPQLEWGGLKWKERVDGEGKECTGQGSRHVEDASEETRVSYG